MVGGSYQDDRTVPVLVAPAGKHLALIFASSYSPRDLINGVNAERSELASRHFLPILIWKAPADELVVDAARRIGENCGSRGHTAVNKIGGLKDSGAIGINSNDNDIGGVDGLHVQNKCRPRSPQNLRSDRRHANRNSTRHQKNRRGPTPASAANDHHPMLLQMQIVLSRNVRELKLT